MLMPMPDSSSSMASQFDKFSYLANSFPRNLTVSVSLNCHSVQRVVM